MELLIPPMRKYGQRFSGIAVMRHFISKLGIELELQFYLYYFQVYADLYRSGYFLHQNRVWWSDEDTNRIPLQQTIERGIVHFESLLEQYRKNPDTYDPGIDWGFPLLLLHSLFENRLFTSKDIKEDMPIFGMVVTLKKYHNPQCAFFYNLPVVVYYNFCQKHGLYW